jgi:hypothetical protein
MNKAGEASERACGLWHWKLSESGGGVALDIPLVTSLIPRELLVGAAPRQMQSSQPSAAECCVE